ncbi:adenylyl-sulfate kinase [Shewanella metallivivens]|uniref:adenylyl-sulfate kinase n=1 Tax=Shewanella metallivivens TaxID=2872342 RepID=UPI0034A426AC
MRRYRFVSSETPRVYKKAWLGVIKHFISIESTYEEPTNANVIVKTISCKVFSSLWLY